ncbi:putative quinol monooxygenase [Cohnella cellulosilytica]|uniref:Quinol monooxygenase n=1 Tax=Cohnella cellulosilytica TaxID=986710 RepID=A0ABW2FJB3_9BACL
MSKFTMFGQLIARPGQRGELAKLMLESAATLQEMEGCIYYIISESVDEPDALWISELWESEEAHAASLKNENVLAVIQRCRPLIAGVNPVKLRLLGGKGI